jgi:CheY-like chemotaxis protein
MDEMVRTATILLVEDDEEDQWATERAFEQSRIRNKIVAVENGMRALDYLHNRGNFEGKETNPPPDLIILDLNMPVMDGREFLDTIKKDPKFKRIPVVVMTTSKQEEDILKTYDLGVNSYVTKPVNMGGFLTVIQELGHYWLEIVVLPPHA